MLKMKIINTFTQINYFVMRSIKHFLLAALAATCCFTGFGANPSNLLDRLAHGKPDIAGRHLANRATSFGGKTVIHKADIADAIEPGNTFSDVPAWSTIEGPDGSTWSWTQTFTASSKFGARYYGSSEITVYDDTHTKVGSFTVTIPEDEQVNDIVPFGAITKKFFDRDEKTWEMMVYVHKIENYNSCGRIEAYNQNGELLYTHEGDYRSFFDASEGFDSYQRLMVAKEITARDGNGKECQVDVIKPCGWNETPTVEHTFYVDYDLVQYCFGSYFNAFNVDGTPYFAISHYEKPYMTDEYDSEGEPIVQENNYFVIDLYDKNYNLVSAASGEEAHTLKIPVELETSAYYTFYEIGTFLGDDITRGTYSGDDQLNFIVTSRNYFLSSDDYLLSFYAYDENGNKIKTISSNVKTWFSLLPVDGYEEQILFLQSVGENEQITMVDIPSGNIAAIFPTTLDGNLLSTNINRYPVGDSYQYVIGLGQGITDNDGNVISRIGWYTKDCELDHFVSFNLGKQLQLFTPYIAESLNPYLVNTDDKHEYVFVAKIKRDNSDVIDDVLYIADEDGNIIKTFKGNDEKGQYTGGGFLDAGMKKPTLLVYYYNYETYTVDFYDLPFEKFLSGGEGTEESPYIIATPGDLFQVRNEPSAYYKLANDIDMSKYPMLWTPIETFSGNFDGCGYTISNLTVDPEANYGGLFGQLQPGAVVKNIIFVESDLRIGEDCFAAGTLCAFSRNATVENIHVYDGKIEGDGSGRIGGIIGQAANESSISECSFNDGEINTPNAEKAGGIVGDMQTSSTVSASTASGKISARSNVGGIVGGTGTASTVSNCHADVVISGQSSVGGIVGASARGPVTNCYAEGSITATGGSVGGIVGSLESNWGTSDGTVVGSCVAALESITATGDAVHRIVGSTITDEEPTMTEAGLADNYAIATLAINETAVEGGETTNTEGGDKAAADLTPAFFESLGYAYGTTAASPWKGETGLPILFFEEQIAALTLDAYTLSMLPEETAVLEATVYGADANVVEFSSSDENVVSVGAVSVDGNKATVTLTCLATGSATITVTAGEKTATCIVLGMSGVENIANEGSAMQIRYVKPYILAENAVSIDLYNLQGMQIATSKSDKVNVEGKVAGVYVVVATDAQGNRTTRKLIIR